MSVKVYKYVLCKQLWTSLHLSGVSFDIERYNILKDTGP